VTGGINVNGTLNFKNDPPMTEAPRMYLTGYVPGPMAALATAHAFSTILSRNIVVTRVTAEGVNPCPGSGLLTFYAESTAAEVLYLNLNSDGSGVDSGPLSIPVAAGNRLYGLVYSPNCGTFGPQVVDVTVSMEYVMQ
jgi:hypothetical protein